MDNDWNDFVQSKPVRLIMNAICAIACGFYGISAVVDLVRPNEQAFLLMETTGTTAFYALTVARMVVCLWVAVVFVRAIIKVLQEED